MPSHGETSSNRRNEESTEMNDVNSNSNSSYAAAGEEREDAMQNKGLLCQSAAEVYVYATCVMLGISMLMPINALTSAPSFMVNYYKYVTHDMNAVPNSKVFWDNILTFYNVASVGAQILVGPTILIPWARKLSLSVRFIIALTLMMLEVLVVEVMPEGKVSQTGAMVAFFIVTIGAGAGKSWLEATCYALAGSMPPKFMSAVMFGCGFSGVIASVLQCIVKATIEDRIMMQAHIYFSLALGFMFVALIMAELLRFNSFAQANVAEFRVLRNQRRGATDDNEPVAADGGKEVTGQMVMDAGRMTEADVLDKERALNEDEEEGDTVRRVDAGADVVEDQSGLTTAQQLQRTKVWPIIKKIYPMQIACFCIFFVSLFIFPSLVIPIDRTDKWFSTLAILCYNCGDATGRLSSSIKFLWPPRWVLVIVSFVRFLFIPLIFLCIFDYIPGHAAPYVFLVCIGLTKGFFGATSMVYGPLTPGLRTEGERVMAGQLMGISLLAGASVSALLALLVVLFLP